MKKFIIFITLLIICTSSAQSGENTVSIESCVALNTPPNISHILKYEIKDELAESIPKVLPVYIKNNEPIRDELFIEYRPSGTVIKLWARKEGEHTLNRIDDELINAEFKKQAALVLKPRNKTKIEDDFIPKVNTEALAAAKAKNEYDFTKEQIPVKLKILKNLTTKNGIIEGSQILFKTDEDVVLNGVKLPRGTKIAGRIETLSESDKMGTPANIVIDNFYVKNHPEICFYGNISKTGANRSIWVYPLYQAGNLVLYVAGFVFVPIHGGHAKLSTNETYTVFYETQ